MICDIQAPALILSGITSIAPKPKAHNDTTHYLLSSLDLRL